MGVGGVKLENPREMAKIQPKSKITSASDNSSSSSTLKSACERASERGRSRKKYERVSQTVRRRGRAAVGRSRLAMPEAVQHHGQKEREREEERKGERETTPGYPFAGNGRTRPDGRGLSHHALSKGVRDRDGTAPNTQSLPNPSSRRRQYGEMQVPGEWCLSRSSPRLPQPQPGHHRGTGAGFRPVCPACSTDLPCLPRRSRILTTRRPRRYRPGDACPDQNPAQVKTHELVRTLDCKNQHPISTSAK